MATWFDMFRSILYSIFFFNLELFVIYYCAMSSFNFISGNGLQLSGTLVVVHLTDSGLLMEDSLRGGGERVRKRVEEVILCCGCNLSHQTVRPIITPSILNHPPFYYLFLRRPPKVALLLLLLLFSLWKATQRLVFIGKVNMTAAKEARLDDSLSLRLYNFETVILL